MNARLPPEEAIGADLLDLVRRCQGGEPDAWRALLAPFQEIGRRALRSFRLPTADSEDILADALTALYAGGLSQFRGGTVAEFIAFLQAVVRNRAIDFVKRQKRQEGHRRNWRQRGQIGPPGLFNRDLRGGVCGASAAGGRPGSSARTGSFTR